MAAIMALFEWDFELLSPRQRERMRQYADKQEREQAEAEREGRPMETGDPSNLAKLAVSRIADSEDRILHIYLIVANVDHLTRDNSRRPMIGPMLPTPLEAAKIILKSALQAIAWRDVVQKLIENGSKKTLARTSMEVMFMFIRPVCNDEYFDKLWKGITQAMVVREFPQESLDYFDGLYETIANLYADTSEDDVTGESGGDSTD